MTNYKGVQKWKPIVVHENETFYVKILYSLIMYRFLLLISNSNLIKKVQ